MRKRLKERKGRAWFSIDEQRREFELPEIALLKIGLILLSIYMLLRVDAFAGAARDLSWLDGVPDTSLWSPSRLDSYRSTPAAPPESVVGGLIIRSLGIEAPIYVDTSQVHLNRGVGLVGEMAVPGASGNVGIAGHRDGYFRALKDIKMGDEIEIVTHDRSFTYRVRDVAIVERSDTSLLRATQSARLTLVTCYPFYFVGSAPQRFIVRSELVRSRDREGSYGREVYASNHAQEPRRQR